MTDANQTLDRLHPVAPTPPTEDQATVRSGVQTLGSCFHFAAAHELSPVPADWLVDGVVPDQGFGHLVGEPSAGKTLIALELAFTVATGQPFCDRPTKQAGVAYFAAEDGRGVARRIAALRDHYAVDKPPIVVSSVCPDLRDPANVNKLLADMIEVRRRFTDMGSPLGLIVIDTFAACTSGVVENEASEMSMILKRIRQIADEAGAFVLVVHHTGKDVSRGMRGWSGQVGAGDLVLAVNTSGDDRILKVERLKHGPEGDKFRFHIDEVEFDVDGLTFAEPVAVFDAAISAGQPKVTTKKEGRIAALEVMQELINELGKLVTVTVNGAPKEVTSVTLKQYQARYDEKMLARHQKIETSRKYRREALNEALKAGLVEGDADNLWLLVS